MNYRDNALISLLNIYVPPLLEHALGCTGQGRFVAYWVHPADGLCWTDGTQAGCCDGLDIWSDFVRDPRVAPFLGPFHMGSETSTAHHWLVLDRKRRRLRIGDVQSAACFMRRHRAPAAVDRCRHHGGLR